MDQEYDVTGVNMEPGREPIVPKQRTGAEPSLPSGVTRVAQEARQAGREKGREILTEQKGKTTRMLSDVAVALHASARQLKEQAHPNTAHYLDLAADGLEDFSKTLNSRDPDALFAEIRDFARRQPAIWIAGTVVAGVLLARLAKSGVEANQPEKHEPFSTQEETIFH